MKLLITGHTGFVGTNMVKYLTNKGYSHMEFLGRNTTPSWDSVQELNNSEVIIHLAGLAHDMNNIHTEHDYYTANVALTIKLYDLFLQSSSAKVFIFISTVAVKGETKSIFSEEDEVMPNTYYGKTKLLAETYILANLPSDKKIYILRPCMIHGEGNKGNLSLLYDFISKGIPYPLGLFNNKRSFLHVDNFSFVVDKLLESCDKIPSGVYHLCDDFPVATKDIITIIGEVKRKNVRVWNVPKFLIYLLALIGDWCKLPINSNRLQKMTENYIVSNQKIKKSLNIELPLSSLEGLKKTINSL